MARTIAVANQKGGVGQTTTALNLAASLALSGQRVLLVDLDPQANLTSGIGLKGRESPAGTIYQALFGSDGVDVRGFVLQTVIEGLALIPSSRDLAGAEIELVDLKKREHRLHNLIESLQADYDLIFIDTPPSLGLLTLNALVAADTVVIPLHCEYFALEGLADLVGTLHRVQAAYNPRLDIEGVVLTMFGGRTNLGQQVSRELREFFKEKVYETVIPRNVRLGEAPSHGVPVILYDAKSRGALAYLALAKEFLERTQGGTGDA